MISDNIVVIEIENWNKIDNYLMKYYNCDLETLDAYECHNYFIDNYINLFNIINFDLRLFGGINIVNEDYLKLIYNDINNSKEYINKFIMVINNPIIIDEFILDDLDYYNLFFIIDSLKAEYSLFPRKKSISFISCLEFMLIKKDEDKNCDSIEKQFINKIKKCCKDELTFHRKELYNLYNYRSLNVHGNYKEIDKCINNIVKKSWYKKYAKENNMLITDDDLNNAIKEELIYDRLYEIFNCVFKLYCCNKEYIDNLKNNCFFE